MNKSISILLLLISSIAANAQELFPLSSPKSPKMLAGEIYVQFKLGTYSKDLAAISLGASYKVKNSLLAREQSETYRTNKAKNNDLQASSELLAAEEPLLRTFVVEFDKTLNPEKVAFHLMRKNPNVEYAEAHYVDELQRVDDSNFDVLFSDKDDSKILTTFTPNDPSVAAQKMLKQINAYEAWFIEKGNPNVVIGISDEGLNQNHPDLAPNLYINTKDPVNGKDDDGDGYIDNFNGYNFNPVNNNDWNNTVNNHSHGTEVGGIAGAAFNNGIGIAGVGGLCKIFPFKVSPKNSSVVTNGYESMIAAANMGFVKILNCSWGNVSNPNFSPIRQNAVTYAVAKDVAIIGVSGNQEISTGPAKYRSSMPGFYFGVLGVGEVDSEDFITDNSGLGEACKIMAPGYGNFTTSGNGYTDVNFGTSYAAPVVSGAMGLVRSKYPNLKAMQAISFLRQCTDNIASVNGNEGNKMPGRINMLKAVTIDPMSIPGFALIDQRKTDLNSSVEKISFNIGDVFNLNLKLKNYLGKADALVFNVSTVYNNNNSDISFTKSSFDFDNVKTNDEITLPLEIKLSNFNINKMLLRIDILGNNNYKDVLFVDFYAFPEVITYQNDAIQFSVGLRGTFGYNSNKYSRQGYGFNLLGYGDALYNGGLLMIADSNSILSANDGFGLDGSDFGYGPNTFSKSTKYIEIVGNFTNARNVLISKRVDLPKGNENYTKLIIRATNESQQIINNLTIGYKLDWDIAYKDEGYILNLGTLLDSDLPDLLKRSYRGGNIFKNKDEAVAFGAAITSDDTTGIAQIANLNSSIGMSNSNILRALNSGKTWLLNSTTDIYGIVGMKFPGILAPNDSKECTICIAGGNNADEYKAAIRKCLETLTSVATTQITNTINIADLGDVIIIKTEAEDSFKLFNILGSQLGNWNNTNQIMINKSQFANGVYFISTQNSSKKFVIGE